MRPIFFYLTVVIFLTRLFFQFRDHPLNKQRTVLKTLLELSGLVLLRFNVSLIFVAVVIVCLNGWNFWLESKSTRLNAIRVITLGTYLLLLAMLSAPAFDVRFNLPLLAIVQENLRQYLGFHFLNRIAWQKSLLTLWGLLFSLNEANIFIRYFFELLKLAPQQANPPEEAPIDMVEYNRGRIIGFLERILIYFFVLNSHWSAIGFIVAAKGITRFKELEQRSFAEYFLIGTLLSTILAGIIALLVQFLIGSIPS